MKIVLETTLTDDDEARTLQDLLNEMGYKTYRYLQYDADDERKTPLAETRLGNLMLTFARKNFGSRSFVALDFEDTLIAHGYRPNSAAPVLSGLAKSGDVERIAHGHYQLKKGQT